MRLLAQSFLLLYINFIHQSLKNYHLIIIFIFTAYKFQLNKETIQKKEAYYFNLKEFKVIFQGCVATPKF